MEIETRKAVHMALKFRDRHLARPILRTLEEERSVEVSILHGRMATEEAWIELKLAGDARRVDALIRNTARLGAAIHPLPLCT